MPLSLDLFALNEPQRQAVLHGEGPLLVLAGAGSGKTRVIVYRMARLLLDGVPAEQILAVTFTNKAALEMRARLAQIGGPKSRGVWLSTFHALGLAILRAEHRAANLPQNFCIYDTADLVSLVRDLLRQAQHERRLDAARVLEGLMRAKKDRLVHVPIVWGDDYELAAYDLYPKFLAQMRAFGAIDFDDLILRSQDVLADPDVAARWQQRFRYILVDEYQDTSPDQLGLLRALCGKRSNICAVGDDDQAIYAWRGAAVDNILQFGRHFAGTQEVVLAQNYRSTPTILNAANHVIAHNSVRKQKTLWSALPAGEPVEVVACDTCEDEANFVAEQIHSLLFAGVSLKDIAVLYRANSQGKFLEEVLRAERLALRVVGGQALFDRKEVRDALAFLTVAYNPRDEVALRRIVNVPPRGLGPSSLERLAAYAEAEALSLWDALCHADKVAGLPRAALAGARHLTQVVASQGQAAAWAPAAELQGAAEAYFAALGLREAIEKANDADGVRQKRLGNLDASLRSLGYFAAKAKAEGSQSDAAKKNQGSLLAAFVRAASLRQEDTQDEDDKALGDKGAVTLMTLHAAKGLEFGYVFLLGLEEDLLPHRRSLEEQGEGASHAISEERRLCYVGMTRAQRRLWLCHARTRRRHGRAEPRTPSRFLDELPKDASIRRVVRAGSDADLSDAEREEKSAQMAKDFFARMRAQLGIEEGP